MVFAERENRTFINLDGVKPADLKNPELVPYFFIKDGDEKKEATVLQAYISKVEYKEAEDEQKGSKLLLYIEDETKEKFILSMFMNSVSRDILNMLAKVTRLKSIKLSLAKNEGQPGKWYANVYVSINGTWSASKGWTGWTKCEWLLDNAGKKALQEVILDSRGNYVKTDSFELDKELTSHIPNINHAILAAETDDEMFDTPPSAAPVKEAEDFIANIEKDAAEQSKQAMDKQAARAEDDEDDDLPI